MAAPDTTVNLAEKFATFQGQWSPKIIGQINDLHLKAVKVEGEFVWHRHDDTDEFFLVHSGLLTEARRTPAQRDGRGRVELVVAEMAAGGVIMRCLCDPLHQTASS